MPAFSSAGPSTPTFSETMEPPPVTDDTRDRLIALEVEVRQLTKMVEGMTATLDRLDNVLQQAKGAKWIVFGLAGLTGFLASKASWFFGWK